MAFTVKDTSNGLGDFEPIPAGLQHAVCYAVIDIGTQPQYGNFPSRPKVIFIWEIPALRIKVKKDDGEKDLPRAISAKYTASLASKGNLRPILEGWRGRAFTEQELAGFDLEKVLGANCMLGIQHKKGTGKNEGKTFAEVSSVNPLMKGMVRLQAENPLVSFSMHGGGKGPIKIPESIPEWIQILIKQSDEYLIAQQGTGHRDADRPPANLNDAEADAAAVDDNIPF